MRRDVGCMVPQLDSSDSANLLELGERKVSPVQADGRRRREYRYPLSVCASILSKSISSNFCLSFVVPSRNAFVSFPSFVCPSP